MNNLNNVLNGKGTSKDKGIGLIGLVATLFSLALVMGLILSAISAAVMMLALSLIHNDLPIVPALGFWASLGLMVSFTLIGQAFRGTKIETK